MSFSYCSSFWLASKTLFRWLIDRLGVLHRLAVFMARCPWKKTRESSTIYFAFHTATSSYTTHIHRPSFAGAFLVFSYPLLSSGLLSSISLSNQLNSSGWIIRHCAKRLCTRTCIYACLHPHKHSHWSSPIMSLWRRVSQITLNQPGPLSRWSWCYQWLTCCYVTLCKGTVRSQCGQALCFCMTTTTSR